MVIGRRARSGQLLLFLALLFGVATMHTLGHPAPGHGTSAHTASHPAAAAAVSPGHLLAPPESRHEAPSAVPVSAAPESPPFAMGPVSVCLAVLDTFTLVLLVAGAARTDPVSLLAACHARILRALRPPARSRKTLLATLAVLRI